MVLLCVQYFYSKCSKVNFETHFPGLENGTHKVFESNKLLISFVFLVTRDKDILKRSLSTATGARLNENYCFYF
jgi:hypothetical protein